MKILITGAEVTELDRTSKLLIENGHDLTLVDNLRNGYLENLKGDSVKSSHPFTKLISRLKFFLKCGDQYDVIIHLVATYFST